jgi:uncharacterized integral membrane protein
MAYRPERSDMSLDETSEGVDKRRVLRLLVAGIAIVLAAVFMSQNNERVQLNILTFELTTRLWVGLLAAVVLGVVLGLALQWLWARRKRRSTTS